MPLRRISSKELQTGAGNSRTQRPGSILRPHVAAAAVGDEEVARGVIHEGHYGARATKDRHVDPALIPRDTFGWEQLPSGDSLVAERTNNFPVRRGGRPIIRVDLLEALATAGEIVLYRNNVSFATIMAGDSRPGPWVLTLVTGQTIIERKFEVPFQPGDRAAHEITDPGVGGAGITVTWWFA